MTEHLPECPNYCIDVPADYMAKNVYMRRCICASLRACEQRVESRNRQNVSELLWQISVTRDDSFAAGLDAAREAVAALDHAPRCELVWGCDCSEAHILECTCNRDDALAAIDALREKQ